MHFSKYYEGDYNKHDWISGAYGRCGRNAYKIIDGKVEWKRDYIAYLGVYKRILLKRTINT
jgi:hypothetical protein